MPSQRTDHRSRVRREPATCQACRARKLKCDRERPCSNCRSRKSTCIYHGELSSAPASAAAASENNAVAENEAMKARIEKLEQVVFGNGFVPALSEHSPAEVSTRTSMLEQRTEGDNAIGDSIWLQGIGTRLEDVLPCFSDPFKVVMRTDSESELDLEQLSRVKRIQIPIRDTMIASLDTYEDHIDATIPILHIPSVREKVACLYAQVFADEIPDIGIVALALAVSSTVASWDLKHNLLSSTAAAKMAWSKVLAKQALLVMEHARNSSQISVEAIQATILLTFYFAHLEGFTTRTRLLHASALTMARDLGLHKVDAPNKKAPLNTQSRIIEMEVSRKVWWHLTCTDWVLAYTGGPSEGVYSIQPQQMMVDKPRNLSHDDLSCQGPRFTRNEDVPTATMYHLQRIKLATICREIVDSSNASRFSLERETVFYEKVAGLDAKFCALLKDLPRVLQLDTGSDFPEMDLGDTYDGGIAIQRVVINMFVHTRRCKLHLPFLIRLQSDSKYKSSQEACLKSARQVLRIQQTCRLREPSEAVVAFLRHGGGLHHVFYATIVLVMDLCVNDPNNRNQIGEAQRAIKAIEQERVSSPVASAFFESLMEILRKYQVNLPSANFKGSQADPSYPKFQEASATRDNGSAFTDTYTHTIEETLGEDQGFEDIWQTYLNNGATLDPQTWEALMEDLEMQVF